MADVIEVAEYILELTGAVTTMKLQKLAYFTQARFLVQNDSPLFANRIEAWANGPVIPDLFAWHRGKFMIGPGELLGPPYSSATLSSAEKDAARKVVAALGGRSGEELRLLTHSEKPWLDARVGYAPGEKCGEEITVAAMLSFYSSPECANQAVR